MVIFNGKINTYGLDVLSYYPYDFNLNNKEFIFVDDSLFSGNTYNKIDNYLMKHNSKIKSASVIYDGSRQKKRKSKFLFQILQIIIYLFFSIIVFFILLKIILF